LIESSYNSRGGKLKWQIKRKGSIARVEINVIIYFHQRNMPIALRSV